MPVARAISRTDVASYPFSRNNRAEARTSWWRLLSSTRTARSLAGTLLLRLAVGFSSFDAGDFCPDTVRVARVAIGSVTELPRSQVLHDLLGPTTNHVHLDLAIDALGLRAA